MIVKENEYEYFINEKKNSYKPEKYLRTIRI
jgi:hypothetical protein